MRPRPPTAATGSPLNGRRHRRSKCGSRASRALALAGACACIGACGCARQVVRNDPPADLAMESLEPRQMLAAQAYDWRDVTVKANGFIDGIVYSPAAPNVVYMHTDMGGAYRWDQTASRWRPLNDWSQWNDWAPQNLGVETMAVDPVDPNRVYMAAGTYMSPTAILRSTDGGRTWLRTDVSGINSNGNGSARNAGERMVVDPNSPNILYYGTRDDGLWKSTDYGATWSNVAAFPTIGQDSGWGADTGIVFVLPDKSSATSGNPTQVIYAGVFDSTAGVNRIYRTTNGGASWAAVPGGQPTPANTFPQRAALTPDGNALYITYGVSTSYPGPWGITEGFVQKVTNPDGATPTWSEVSPPVTYGFSAVALDPTDPNIVYVGELGNYNPADRIWRSTNGGQSWTAINPNSNRNDSSAPYATSLGVHWLGDLQIDPFNRDIAIFTTGYGLYRTTNLTAANPQWAFFNEGFEQSAVLELSSPANGAVNLVSAIGDRDGYRHEDFAQSPVLGRFGQSQDDPTRADTSTMAKGTSDDIDTAWDNASYIVRTVRVSPYVQASADNGVTWSWLTTSSASGSGNGGNRIAISADGTKAVYEPGGTGRLRYSTRTGASTWSAWTTNGITNQPADGANVVAELVTGSKTFYAYAGTTFSRSNDGGATWAVMTTSAPASGEWIRAVPNQAGHLLMSRRGSGLWRTVDGGATWMQIAAGTVTTANVVGVGAGPTAGAYPSIYVGGTVSGQPGFFRSDDQGASWTMISDLAHQYGWVTVIQGDARVYGRLYVGTNGRGIQVGDIHTGPTTLPSGWSRQDIGNPASTGSGGVTGGQIGGSWEVIGGGLRIGGQSDQFGFAYTAITGDVTITARVVEVPNASPANNLAKAGVMIRADLTAGSPNAFAAMTPGSVNGAISQHRLTTNTATTVVVNPGVWNPYWVRLTRAGNLFTAQRSADGVSWTHTGTPQTIAMNATVYVGLATTASDNNQVNIARFDNVSIRQALTINGTSGDDAILITRNGTSGEAWLNGTLLNSFDPAMITSLTIDALGGADTIVIDVGSGSPLPATGTSILGGTENDAFTLLTTAGADTVVFAPASAQINDATIAFGQIEQLAFDGRGGFDDLSIAPGASVTSFGVQRLDELSVAGLLSITADMSTGLGAVVRSISITGAGTLDLSSGDLLIDYSDATPLPAIRDLISAARNGGDWLGTGITSSAARLDSLAITTLGAIESADFLSVYGPGTPFDGEALDGSMILVKYTYYGDTDFNGTVDFDDYVRLDATFNDGGVTSDWFHGDLDASGTVDFDDYVLLDAAFNGQSDVL